MLKMDATSVLRIRWSEKWEVDKELTMMLLGKKAGLVGGWEEPCRL